MSTGSGVPSFRQYTSSSSLQTSPRTTLSLSFNNDGPLGSFFRYICDNGTYKAFYDDLSDGKDNKIDVSKVDVSMDGIELEDREFIAAIKEKREPNASLAQLLPCMRVLGRLEQIVDPKRQAHA